MATELSYICKRTVVSTKAMEPRKFFPLSVLDCCMENNHVRMVYYYQTSREVALGEVTKKLRETLSEMLTHFPIVTGRLVRDERGHWKIKCNDAGVRMVEAKAKGSVERWLKNVDREKELQLVHWEDMFHKPYYWSTFYVQVTEFEEGGLAIGLSCVHLLADFTCATTFMKAWSDISIDNKIITPPLFHPLPLPRQENRNLNYHHPNMELIHYYQSLIEKPICLNEVRYTTISMGFSSHKVQACMSMAQPNGPITPFEALTTLFWVSLSKVKGLRTGLVGMSICLDMRKVLGLDSGFFGNCMVYNKVHVEGNNYELPQVVRAISDVVAKMDGERIMDLIEWLENDDVNLSTMMNGHDLVCASLESVDPYLAVFQDRFKPIHVSVYVEPVLGEGQVLILPGPPGEGPLSRVAMVTLREEEATKLCEDYVISQFSPTILMRCQ